MSWPYVTSPVGTETSAIQIRLGRCLSSHFKQRLLSSQPRSVTSQPITAPLSCTDGKWTALSVSGRGWCVTNYGRDAREGRPEEQTWNLVLQLESDGLRGTFFGAPRSLAARHNRKARNSKSQRLCLPHARSKPRYVTLVAARVEFGVDETDLAVVDGSFRHGNQERYLPGYIPSRTFFFLPIFFFYRLPGLSEKKPTFPFTSSWRWTLLPVFEL